MDSFIKRVSAVQNELKAPKGQYNKFGKYMYRSCEDILEAVKPVCKANSMLLHLSDKIVQIGNRYYVEATAKLMDLESSATMESTAYAREADAQKGMDESQITGTASSYARKYALNGLLNIDDSKDADTDEFKAQQDRPTQAQQKPQTRTQAPQQMAPQQDLKFRCPECGREYVPYTDGTGRIWSPREQYEAAARHNPDGVPRCGDCRRKLGR